MQTFGECQPGLRYQSRPAVYAIIFNSIGQIALVREANKLFLPGGGIDGQESIGAALHREVREECCWTIRIGRRLGEAVQHFIARDGAYASHGTYFVATISGEVEGVPEHQVSWLEPKEALKTFYHQAHRWAVEQALAAQNS